MPTIIELEDRIAALERLLDPRQGRIPVGALPLKPINERLKELMVPEGDQFMLPHTAGPDSLSFMPNALVKREAAQNIASAVWTPLQFDTAVVNQDMQWSSGVPTRLIVVRPGLYLLNAGSSWDGVVDTEQHQLAIQLNGAGVIGGGPIVATSGSTSGAGGAAKIPKPNASTLRVMAAGEYAELFVYQDSGAPRNTSTANEADNYLAAVYVSHVEGL